MLAAICACAAEPRRPAVSLGGGVLDVLRHDRAGDFMCDFRFGGANRLEPRVLATWATEGSRFLGLGLLLHATPAPGWDIAVGFAPGYYEREHGPRLGLSLEFFSSIEVSRELPGGRRFGLSIGHISNGSFGDENPGAETVHVFWQVPLKR